MSAVARLAESVCVGIIVGGAEQVDDVTLQIVFFKFGGRHGLVNVCTTVPQRRLKRSSMTP